MKRDVFREIIRILRLYFWTAIVGSTMGSSMRLLGLNYSKLVPPLGPDGGPVTVRISMHILDVMMDESAQTMKFDCYFRSIWQDDRIILPNMTEAVQLDTAITSKLWLPNTFFVNVQSVSKPRLLTAASGVSLFENKTIFHSSLCLTKVKCNLKYHNYPMDRQTCVVRMESYGYTNKAMVLDWHNVGITKEKGITMRSFYLEEIRTNPPITIDMFLYEYSELSFEISFRRQARFSVLAVYVPSSLLIVVSWLSLWVPPEMVPGRMVLAITTLLTLTALFNASVHSMPEVSYVKAIDVWTLACIVFVFGTIVEYIIVLRLSHAGTKTAIAPTGPQKGPAWKAKDGITNEEKAARLEKIYRLLSPFAFLLFNIVYWPYYLRA